MPNKIDSAPLSTVVPVTQAGVDFSRQPTWAKWLQQIVKALYRPQWSGQVTFPLTASGTSSDFDVNFPLNTVQIGDFPVLGAPVPPSAGTTFTAHISVADQVVIRFNNYSGGPLAVPPITFFLTILRK